MFYLDTRPISYMADATQKFPSILTSLMITGRLHNKDNQENLINVM